jgi:hypothetical protein
MVLTEKICEPWPPSLAGCYHPLCNGLAGRWRAKRKLGAGGAHEGIFYCCFWMVLSVHSNGIGKVLVN